MLSSQAHMASHFLSSETNPAFGKLRSFTEPRSASRMPCVIKMWFFRDVIARGFRSHVARSRPSLEDDMGMWLNEMSLDSISSCKESIFKICDACQKHALESVGLSET